MPSSKEHYAQVLSPVYSWMFGGFQAALERNNEFFERHELSPKKTKIAVDLGAGCGFQSIPLAQAGYNVTSIDLDKNLLSELDQHAKGLSITIVEDDLLRFKDHIETDVELAVCMTDTLLHLESRKAVRSLFAEVLGALCSGGKFIVTFRDLTQELVGLDRFIPVRSDATTIFTCFLEYEPETVKVNDIVYRQTGSGWEFSKSYYRKLRVSEKWVIDEFSRAGFSTVDSSVDRGFVTVIATRGE